MPTKKEKEINKRLKEALKAINLVKPTFSLFKSFIRLFSKKAFAKEYNEYQEKLEFYNSTVEDIKSQLKANYNSKDKVINNIEKPKSKPKSYQTPSRQRQRYNVSQPRYFNNLRVCGATEDYDDYALDIMSKKTGLPLNERTAEYITLGSFNIEELTDVQEFIKDKPELKHLEVALNFKIDHLFDESRPKGYTRNDKPCNCKANSYFVQDMIKQRFISDIRRDYSDGISPYDILSNNNNTIANKIKKNVKEVKITSNETNNSVILNGVSKTEVQSSGNGCWSCSLNVLLKQQGVDNLTQEDIRTFRPDASLNQMTSDSPTADIKNRIKLSYRLSNDVPNEIADVTDLIHKATNKVAYRQKQITGDPNVIYQEIEKVLREKKKPVSLLYRGHYRTVIGVEDGNLILEDSYVGYGISKYYHASGNNDNEYYYNKYPNNSVESVANLDSYENPVTISYLEDIKNIKPEDYAKENMNGMNETNHYARKEGRTFSKIDTRDNAIIFDDIVLPNSYLENVKNLNGVTLKNHTVKQIEVNIERSNSFVPRSNTKEVLDNSIVLNKSNDSIIVEMDEDALNNSTINTNNDLNESVIDDVELGERTKSF